MLDEGIEGSHSAQNCVDANILSALGVETNENIITNMMAYCINVSPSFARIFLIALGCTDRGGCCTYQAITRPKTTAGCPDLVVSVECQSKYHLVVIENKINAEEGYDQTRRYSQDSCSDELAECFRNTHQWASKDFVLWTLFLDQEAESEDFHSATYRDLIHAIEKKGFHEDGLPGDLIRSFCPGSP